MSVVASPCRHIIGVPYTLKVCGERAVSRGGNKEISAVLEEKYFKICAFISVLVSLEKLVGSKRKVGFLCAEIDRNSVKEILIIF